jgi:hypothetical protein
MGFDTSRFTFDPWKDYCGVVMEQGRVQLDSDWNEWLAELARRIQAGTMDMLGRTGAPSITPYAFEITAATDDSGNSHISIGAGRMYVDGLLAENHGLAVSWLPPITQLPSAGVQWDPALDELSGAPQVPSPAEVTVDYTQQPYLPGAALPTGSGTFTFLAYLDVWQRPVTYIEDPGLIEKAVGVDTTGRVQTVWQVKLLDVTSVTGVTCSTPDANIPTWQSLIQPSAGQLSTTIVQSTSSGPCCLASTTGYTGQENQLYRVQIHAANLYGWNANTLYVLGAEAVDSNGNLERVIVAGRSASTTPAWPATIGGTVTDGTVTWQLVTTSYKPVWKPNTAYASGAQVIDSNGNLETAVAPGTSGSAPPTWPTTAGATVTDGTTGLIWQYGQPATPTFKWSDNNASVATAVTGITSVTNTAHNPASQLAVESLGRDQVLGFAQGNWVEITDDWQELNGQPGELHQIDDIDPAAKTITLDSPVSSTSFPTTSGLTDPGRHTRLTRWDQSGKVYLSDGVTVWTDLGATGSTGDIPVPPAGTPLILENGITVAFSLNPASGSFDVGDFWTFAARTADGSVEQLTQAPPRGIEHHYCRLALLSFNGTNWSQLCDCRSLFPPAAQRAGIHVTQVLALDANNNPSPLQNDASLPVISLIGGIRVVCDGGVAPASVKRPTCFVTVEWPAASDQEALRQFYSAFVVPANVGAADDVIFWRPQSDYSTGITPVAIAVADFNGDGYLDAAVVNQSGGASGPGTVSILLGSVDGTLTAAPNPPATGNAPIALATGDFNGDKKPDLAVVNQADKSLSILLGNGDGTFAAVPLPPEALSAPAAPALTAVAPAAGSTPPPAGTYQVEVTYVSSSGESSPSGASSITTSESNLAIQVSSPPAAGNATGWNIYVTTSGGSSFFRQNTTPVPIGTNWTLSSGINTASASPPILPVTGNTPVAIVVADFNNDGHPDLAVLNKGDSTVSIFLGNVDGTFKPANTLADINLQTPVALATADFNGDRNLDLAVVNQGNNSVSILLGNGDGTFKAPTTAATGNTPVAIAVADFNGDGKPDLAVVNQAGSVQPDKSTQFTVSILLGNGDGTFAAHVDYTSFTLVAGSTVSNAPVAIAVQDFNGDGKPDLAVLNSATLPAGGTPPPGSVSILMGNGDGTFQPYAGYAVGENPDALVAGEFTSDGYQDLAVLNNPPSPGAGAPPPPGTVSILLGNGDGTFQPRVVPDWLINLPNFIPLGDKGILARLTLKGNFIWSQCDPEAYLDGDTFGVAQGGQSTGLSFPSGDGRPGGDFEMWFWLTAIPRLAISPTTLTFNAQSVGTTSQPQTVTLTNVGNLPITISNITISGDFAETNTCIQSPFTITPAAPTGIVAATGLAARPGSASLQQAKAVAGVTARAALAAQPASARFRTAALATSVRAGAALPSASISPGARAVTGGGVSLGGSILTGGGIFRQPIHIPTLFPFATVGVLQPGASCTISVTFTPTTFGERTGALTIIDNAYAPLGTGGVPIASPHVASLTGTGGFFEIGGLGGLTFRPTLF